MHTCTISFNLANVSFDMFAWYERAKRAREKKSYLILRDFFWRYLTLYVKFVVFLGEHCTF